MNINDLFTGDGDGMRTFTEGQRDTLIEWAGESRQIAQIIAARLNQDHIDGDRPWSAGRRARKVARKQAKVARLLEQAAAETEALNAVYRREVVELPARRTAALEKKEAKRARRAITAGQTREAVAKSLTKTTNSLTGTPVGNPQVNAVQQPQYVNPQPYTFPGQNSASQPLPAFGDLFNQEAG
ncbi:hypothetical protein SUDANB145_07227 (plasmid) [Streptomyces sp. enrichment culture]|uniref:hypothetical protein n=1 Tax=Streptomyces sp. enrichment culture TaxID=1795815 RepID=UPI003F5608BA